MCNYAASNGHIHVLEWLKLRNIHLSMDGIECAAENGHVNVLEWAKLYKLAPSGRRPFVEMNDNWIGR